MELPIILYSESWSWDKHTLWQYLSEGNFPRSCPQWKEFFIRQSQHLYNISNSISPGPVYPPLERVFRAFIPMNKIKVVIIGQDPYHNGSAVGLCFSVKHGNKINPSLRSIYKELELEGFKPQKNGDLSHWADQGCMMINTALTVKKGQPESHLDIWRQFTIDVIKEISTRRENIAWLIMGSKALEFKKYISSDHKLFITSHPMPLSAYKGFRGYPAFINSNVFQNINQFLGNPIEW